MLQKTLIKEISRKISRALFVLAVSFAIPIGVMAAETLPTAPQSGYDSATNISIFTKFEAENYNDQSGIQKESCNEGGEYVGDIENGDYVVYKNISCCTCATSFQARVSSATSGGDIEIRIDSIDGPLLGTCTVDGTGGWQTWVTKTFHVSGAKGVHDLYLKFTGGSGYLFNINWFTFIKESVTTAGDLNGDTKIDATDYALMKMYLIGSITDFPVQNNLVAGDLNLDGVIDVLDLSVFKEYLLGDIPNLPYSL